MIRARGFYRALYGLVCLLIVGCAKSPHRPELAGTTAGFTRLTMLEGPALARQDLYGKKTVLLFWATWCHGSRPLIEKLNEYAAKQDQSKVRFIAVSLDKPEAIDKVQERISARQLNNLEHSFSGNEGWDEAYYSLKGENMPYVVVLDEETRVILTGDDLDTVKEALGDEG